MIGTGAGGIVMGLWMDKRGVVYPVLFGSVMIALGAMLASQSEGRWSLYVANGLLIGLLGKAAMIAPLVANATRWFDKRRGLAVAIISSATPYQVAPAARTLDIEHVLCTHLQVEDGEFTGAVVRPICFGPGKVIAAERLARFFSASVELMTVLARAAGHRRLGDFNIDDLTTFKRDMADLTGVAYGGVAGR